MISAVWELNFLLITRLVQRLLLPVKGGHYHVEHHSNNHLDES